MHQRVVVRPAHGDAVHRLAVIQRPHFRAQNPQTHLHEPMIQVREHDIIAALGDVVVERNRAALMRVRMIQTGSIKNEEQGVKGGEAI